MLRCTVLLYDHIGTGLILPAPTGIEYVQQAGGTACLQLRCEGVFVPFGNDFALDPPALLGPENELLAYFEGPAHRGTGATSGLTSRDADALDQILSRHRAFRGVRVDRTHLRDSCEAWVRVELDAAAAFHELVTGIECRTAILTWQNSD